MFSLALFEPEIPPNTGNIIRLCANAGCQLHLIEPLGFDLDEKKVRRAGLDYHELSNITTHSNYEQFISHEDISGTVYAISTKGTTNFSEVEYQSGDVFLFGPETRGLPDAILDQFPAERILRIPMVENSRSLNLSNAAAIVLFEAWRQSGYAGSRT